MIKTSKIRPILSAMFLLIFIPSLNMASEEMIELPVRLEIYKDTGSILDSLTYEAEYVDIVDEGSTIQIVILSSELDSERISKFTKKHLEQLMVLKMRKTELHSGLIKEEINNGTMVIRIVKSRVPDFILEFLGKGTDSISPLRNSAQGVVLTNGKYKLSHDAFEKGDIKKAIEYAKEAVAIEPKSVMKRMWLGNLLAENNEINRSIDEFENAKSVISKNEIYKYPGLFLSLGDLYYTIGNYDKSLLNYSTLEDNLKAHFGKAKVFEKLGKTDEAISEYNFLINSGDTFFAKEGEKNLERLNETKESPI